MANVLLEHLKVPLGAIVFLNVYGILTLLAVLTSVLTVRKLTLIATVIQRAGSIAAVMFHAILNLASIVALQMSLKRATLDSIALMHT